MDRFAVGRPTKCVKVRRGPMKSRESPMKSRKKSNEVPKDSSIKKAIKEEVKQQLIRLKSSTSHAKEESTSAAVL